MKKILVTSILYCALTAVLLGIGYPLLITLVARLTMPYQATGQLVYAGGAAGRSIVGSTLIGQTFTGPAYFNSRPSAAGSGYDATDSSGSNYAPTNNALVARVKTSVRQQSNGQPVPIDLVTASGSGLDPDITPAAAYYQASRIAAARHLSAERLRQLVRTHIEGRQLGLLGEPRVNVLELNLALTRMQPAH